MKDTIRNNILTLLLVILTSISYSQEYDLTYYFVGFMSDYMGRQISKGAGENDYKIDDFFHQYNLHNLYRLDTLLKTNNKNNKKIEYTIMKRKEIKNCSNCDEFFDLFSKRLSRNINRFYSFKKDKLNSDKHIKRYNGSLKSFKIKLANRKKQLSYLAGAFYRYGNIDSTGYYFKFSNSFYKKEMVKWLLYKYDCNILKEFNNQIEGLYIAPTIEIIFIEPSNEIKKIFDNELNIKKELIDTHATQAKNHAGKVTN